ncbi:MAG: hypothetical protein K0R50_1289 [Eubacterium sp.]|jgi:predicted phage tail protein|nr:hypothetical protein [Eubacterium sp.]
MGKLRIKRIFTLLFGAVAAGLFCLVAYLISLKVTYNIKETLFLLGLVMVLSGIVILISRNQNKAVNIDLNAKQDTEDSKAEDNAAVDISILLSGFNGFTVVVVGVFILIVDAFLK